MVSAAVVKSPNAVKQRAGLIGARTRWAGHVPRHVHLAELGPEARQIVIALLDAARAQAAKNETPAAPEKPAGVSATKSNPNASPH